MPNEKTVADGVDPEEVPRTVAGRSALVCAATAGLLSVVVAAFSMAYWFHRVCDYDATYTRSCHGGILAYQGLMLCLVLLVLVTSMVVLYFLARREQTFGVGYLALGIVSGLGGLLMISSFWDRGWYLVLESAGPVMVLVLACAQCIGLIVAGIMALGVERAAESKSGGRGDPGGTGS